MDKCYGSKSVFNNRCIATVNDKNGCIIKGNPKNRSLLTLLLQ